MSGPETLHYQTGFGNEHETEAAQGALPQGRFNPQKAPYGLYAEQFSSTAFTAPRHLNRRTWTYRIRPSVVMGDYEPYRTEQPGLICTGPLHDSPPPPNSLRWDPFPIPEEPQDFIDGWITLAVNGDARLQVGIGVHIYCANSNMDQRFFYNADGELLIVPQQGALLALTEMGRLYVTPGEILVIPRGVKFQIELPEGTARGYICENYGAPLELPERGPVGANGFANNRDFCYPTAWYEDKDGSFLLVTKFAGVLYQATLEHSPLDVVAWVGNSAPYKYDLARFNTINTVSYDHPDPSIFTVLTSPSDRPGTANLDFVIFPPRWMVAEDTFRPPWFHRNVMSECMGLIQGVYDAKEAGFEPGGLSVHNCMSPHGPEAEVFEKASAAVLAPERYKNSLAFMFESRYMLATTPFGLGALKRQKDYVTCWKGLKKHFSLPPQGA
ncbi:homogentisate 1,2-dioxygenase [Aestuariicella hydrocarbonica]|uniref:Homogentisate 1,2-dioxygenase n=1 Tax=Pseudomaricurvus hydrocarbonicus TaxID=1470433 RepID=A0A9E5JWM8_9GAMM|nr:homogentisate 1,2-dioxygenase [Aestuariicella hydrocarbonica]NHO66943.1 homogentisate 1,2-dioxygenase [Aestuariicella hydrocarbonica]